jgi:hypothetical protein
LLEGKARSLHSFPKEHIPKPAIEIPSFIYHPYCPIDYSLWDFFHEVVLYISELKE